MIDISTTLPRSLNKQLRFATARALTDAAFAARESVNQSLEQELTIRNTWSQRGTKVVKATRANPVALVGTTRDYLQDHVTGGERERNAIPTRKRRPNKQRVVRRRHWPGASRGGRFFFVDNDKLPEPFQRHAGQGERLLFRRGVGRRRRLALLWVLPRTQQMAKRWDFLRAVELAAHDSFSDALPNRLEQALKSAR